MTTKLKSAIIASGVAMVALTGVVGGAQAGGGKLFHKHNFHRHNFLYAPVVINDGCYFYKKMWWKTGFSIWKRKYYVCKGWW